MHKNIIINNKTIIVLDVYFYLLQTKIRKHTHPELVKYLIAPDLNQYKYIINNCALSVKLLSFIQYNHAVLPFFYKLLELNKYIFFNSFVSSKFFNNKLQKTLIKRQFFFFKSRKKVNDFFNSKKKNLSIFFFWKSTYSGLLVNFKKILFKFNRKYIKSRPLARYLQFVQKLYKLNNNVFINDKSRKHCLYVFKNKENNVKRNQKKLNKYTKRWYIRKLKVKKRYYGKLKYKHVKFYLKTTKDDKTGKRIKLKKPIVYVLIKKALVKRRTDAALSSFPGLVKLSKTYYRYFLSMRRFGLLKKKNKASRLVPHLFDIPLAGKRKLQPKKRIFFRKKDKDYEELKTKHPELYDMLFDVKNAVNTKTLYGQPGITSIRTKVNNNFFKQPLSYNLYLTKNFKQYLRKFKNSKIKINSTNNDVMGFFNRLQLTSLFGGFRPELVTTLKRFKKVNGFVNKFFVLKHYSKFFEVEKSLIKRFKSKFTAFKKSKIRFIFFNKLKNWLFKYNSRNNNTRLNVLLSLFIYKKLAELFWAKKLVKLFKYPVNSILSMRSVRKYKKQWRFFFKNYRHAKPVNTQLAKYAANKISAVFNNKKIKNNLKLQLRWNSNKNLRRVLKLSKKSTLNNKLTLLAFKSLLGWFVYFAIGCRKFNRVFRFVKCNGRIVLSSNKKPSKKQLLKKKLLKERLLRGGPLKEKLLKQGPLKKKSLKKKSLNFLTSSYYLLRAWKKKPKTLRKVFKVRFIKRKNEVLRTFSEVKVSNKQVWVPATRFKLKKKQLYRLKAHVNKFEKLATDGKKETKIIKKIGKKSYKLSKFLTKTTPSILGSLKPEKKKNLKTVLQVLLKKKNSISLKLKNLNKLAVTKVLKAGKLFAGPFSGVSYVGMFATPKDLPKFKYKQIFFKPSKTKTHSYFIFKTRRRFKLYRSRRARLLPLNYTSGNLYKKNARRVWRIRWKRVYKKLKIRSASRSIRSFLVGSNFFINKNYLKLKKNKKIKKFKFTGSVSRLSKNNSKVSYVKFKDNNFVTGGTLYKMHFFSNRAANSNTYVQPSNTIYLKKINKYFKNLTKVFKFKKKNFKNIKNQMLVPLVVKGNTLVRNKKKHSVDFHFKFKKKKQLIYGGQFFLQNFNKKKKKLTVRKKTLPRGLSFKYLNFFIFNNYTFKNNTRFYELFINYRVRYRGWSAFAADNVYEQQQSESIKNRLNYIRSVRVQYDKTFCLSNPGLNFFKNVDLFAKQKQPGKALNTEVITNDDLFELEFSQDRAFSYKNNITDLSIQFIKILWDVQDSFRSITPRCNRVNRWRFKKKFQEWYRVYRKKKNKWFDSASNFPLLTDVLTKLGFVSSKYFLYNLLKFNFIFLNNVKVKDTDARLAVGDLITLPKTLYFLEKNSAVVQKRKKQSLQRNQKIQQLIVTSQWRDSKLLRPKIFQLFQQYTYTAVPDWLQVDYFAGYLSVVKHTSNFLNQKQPEEGFTMLAKLTPWRLKI